jgi:hypothetical protein
LSNLQLISKLDTCIAQVFVAPNSMKIASNASSYVEIQFMPQIKISHYYTFGAKTEFDAFILLVLQSWSSISELTKQGGGALFY